MLVFFLTILIILVSDFILIVTLRYKDPKNKFLIYIFAIIYACALFFLPFFDPLQLSGFWASVILQNSEPTLYGFIVGLIVINCGIYGIHIFLSSTNLLIAERYRGRLITIGQFSKRRCRNSSKSHPGNQKNRLDSHLFSDDCFFLSHFGHHQYEGRSSPPRN